MGAVREWFPAHGLMAAATSVPAFATGATLSNTTTHDLGFVFHNDTGGSITITKVMLLQDLLVGSPGTMRVGIQGVAATGLNSGTWSGTSNLGYVDVSSWSGANDDLFVEYTLGEAVTIAVGEVFCIYAKPQSGTWDGSNNVTYRHNITGPASDRNPYLVVNAAKVSATVGVVAFKSDSQTYGFPIQTFANLTPTNSSNPGEFGLKFTVPTHKCSTYKVGLIRITGSLTASRSGSVKLYDSDGTTEIATGTFDSDQNLIGQTTVTMTFATDPLPTLTAGLAYRATLQPGAASSGTYSAVAVPASADMAAITPHSVALTTRNGTSGAFSDTATTLPLIQVGIVDMTIPASGLSAPKVGPGLLVRA